MGTSNFRRIGSIDPKNVIDEYKHRALDELSDAELFDQVRLIVARPPARGLTSFTLHAPLEVMARYGLMRLVASLPETPCPVSARIEEPGSFRENAAQPPTM